MLNMEIPTTNYQRGSDWKCHVFMDRIPRKRKHANQKGKWAL